jgi:hypothetical protein
MERWHNRLLKMDILREPRVVRWIPINTKSLEKDVYVRVVLSVVHGCKLDTSISYQYHRYQSEPSCNAGAKRLVFLQITACIVCFGDLI